MTLHVWVNNNHVLKDAVEVAGRLDGVLKKLKLCLVYGDSLAFKDW